MPLIARVNGACMAGGMGLMAMCDLAVASEAALFGLPEVNVGLFPAQVLSVLQHLMPRRGLIEMCLCGEAVLGQRSARRRTGQLCQRRSRRRVGTYAGPPPEQVTGGHSTRPCIRSNIRKT